MSESIRCSVAMATYNGELYIAEQIESILKNMEENDELIISDDGSSDSTRRIIEDYIKRDGRIKLVDGPRNGVISNFENALKHVNGEIIFLCDQDDIWAEDKIEKVLSAMKDDVTLVLHDAEVFQNSEIVHPSFMEHRGSKLGIINNLIKNSYIGCCMAFKREILEYALPFPKQICMHDQWIGLLNEIYGKSYFIKEKLLYYRRHGNNVSALTGQKMTKRIKDRVFMICCLMKRKYAKRK